MGWAWPGTWHRRVSRVSEIENTGHVGKRRAGKSDPIDAVRAARELLARSHPAQMRAEGTVRRCCCLGLPLAAALVVGLAGVAWLLPLAGMLSLRRMVCALFRVARGGWRDLRTGHVQVGRGLVILGGSHLPDLQVLAYVRQ